MTPSSPSSPSGDERWSVSDRALRYLTAILVVVVGVICGAAIPGTTGGTICTAVVGIGLVAVVSMIFYDVGLTEDRDRARQAARLERLSDDRPRRADGQHHDSAGHGSVRGHRSSLGRMRSERRRLR